MNKVILIGNVGQDPELRHSQGGMDILQIRMATSESWVTDGEKKEKTEWHTVVVFGKSAGGLGKFLRKGMQIAVDGRLQTRSWEDKEGNKRYSTEIIGHVDVLTRKSEGHYGQENPTYGKPDDGESGAPDDDDIPF